MTLGAEHALLPYLDHTRMRYGRHCHPYHSYSESGSSYHPRTPNVPRPIPNALFRLTAETLKCNKNLGWSLDWAVAFLAHNLDPATSPDAPATLRKVRIRAQQIAKEGGLSDVTYRIFDAIDEALFASHLRDAVYLAFNSMGTDVSGATYSHGHGPNPRVRRITILLNSDVHKNASPSEVVASLIHHMIHAYFLVACGPQNDKETSYGRLAHGLHFAKIMRIIKQLSSAYGPPLRLGFGHPLGLETYFDGNCRLRSSRGRLKWQCSHCPANMEPVREGDVERWFDSVCKPLLDLPDAVQKSSVLIYNKRNELEKVPRGQTTRSTSSVEFLFEDESVLVPDAKLEKYPSIRRAFDKIGTRYLAMPKKTPKEAFLSLLQLLHTGCYGPDITTVTAPGRKGPPVIKAIHHAIPPCLLTDARMFKLGYRMEFEEVKSLALKRMRDQVMMREDPVHVLKDIYDGGGDPDPKIRAWVKQFLVRAPEEDGWLEGSTGNSNSGGSVGDASEAPNLMKLERELAFKARFHDLVGQSSALQIDVQKAREHLLATGRVVAPCRALVPFTPQPAPPPAVGVGVGMGMGMGMMGGLGTREIPLTGYWAQEDLERFRSAFGGHTYEGFRGMDSYFRARLAEMARLGLVGVASVGVGPMGIGVRPGMGTVMSEGEDWLS